MKPEIPKIILASASPRRRELLAEAGYEFEVRPPAAEAECGLCSEETAAEFVARLAYQKAADIARRISDEDHGKLIVAGDTVAQCRGQILGKPSDERHAREMLSMLSGREHDVYSGLCLWPLDGRPPSVRVDRTILRMDELKERELAEYLASDAWEGKAGAFGYQDRLGWVQIKQVSETNVVGLPMELFAEMLAELFG